MVGITKFLKIKSYRIFKDFSWPRDLPAFARYNLFYGWNGSGKSTLSSLFSNMQRKESVNEGDVSVEIGGATGIRGSNFSTATIPPVRVFDEQFIRDTLVAVQSARAKPIFYLGQQSAEDARALKSKRDELKSVRDVLVSAISDAKAKTSAKERYASEQARLIKNHFSGSQTYVTFTKKRFIDGVARIKESQHQFQPLSEDEKTALDRKRFLQPKSDVKCVGGIDVGLKQLVESASDILDQTVVSTVLNELVSNPPLAKWVQDGLALHSGEHHTTKCRFCGNEFPEEKRRAYEAHFNDAYTRFQDAVRNVHNDVELRMKQLDVTLPAESSLYDDLQSEYRTAVANITAAISDVKAYQKVLLTGLEMKKSRPFERMQLADVLQENGLQISDVSKVEEAIAECFKVIGAIIERHNKQTTEIAKERDSAYTKLVRDWIVAAIPEYDTLVAEEKTALDKQNGLQARQDSLAREVDEIESRLIESRVPVDELNGELHSYLGRDELSFKFEDAGYRLLRSGRIANNLSEGENTAIAFLYFLKTLNDRSFDKANGVVVIDDPVSSLDDNALFSAFAFMKERVKDCGQLFVLTHNFSFFRQVKNWMFHLPDQKKKNLDRRPGRFYGLKCSMVDNDRAAAICALDPLLLEFESEYHFLFKTLCEVANAPGGEGLARYYNVPNIARRVLESFLAYYVPDKQGELFHKLEGIPYDEAIKTRILRLLNTYSHSATIAENGHDPTVLSETHDVVKELLEMIKTLDANHYNGMLSLISAADTEDEESGA